MKEYSKICLIVGERSNNDKNSNINKEDNIIINKKYYR